MLLTLNNKYQYQLKKSKGNLATSDTVDKDGQLTFAAAKTAVGTDSSGRAIAAFKNDGGSRILSAKDGETTLTFNSNILTNRVISLTAVPVFTYTVKDGNDVTLPQTGTEDDPYILKFTLTAAERCLHVSVPAGEFFGEIGTSFDTTGVLSRSLGSSPYNTPSIGIMNSLTEAAIPSTPVKVTLADSGTGAARDFYVQVKKVIPEYKINIIAPAGIDTETIGGNMYYCLTNSELNAEDKKFKLMAVPVNSSDSFPTGTEFTWSYGSTTAYGNQKDVTVGTMCSISSLPSSGNYPITCEASLAGAIVPENPASTTVYIKGVTVETVSIEDLNDAWLASHTANTAATPYRLNVTGITDSNLATLKNFLSSHTDRYVDLSRTSLSGVTDMLGALNWVPNLTAAPSIPEGVTTMRNCFDMGNPPSNTLSGPSTIVIPSTVTDMFKCFMKCTELKNVNIIVKANLIDGNAWLKTFIHITADQNITVYVLNDAVKNAMLSPTHHDGDWYNNTTNAGVNIVVGLPPGF